MFALFAKAHSQKQDVCDSPIFGNRASWLRQATPASSFVFCNQLDSSQHKTHTPKLGEKIGGVFLVHKRPRRGHQKLKVFEKENGAVFYTHVKRDVFTFGSFHIPSSTNAGVDKRQPAFPLRKPGRKRSTPRAWTSVASGTIRLRRSSTRNHNKNTSFVFELLHSLSAVCAFDERRRYRIFRSGTAPSRRNFFFRQGRGRPLDASSSRSATEESGSKQKKFISDFDKRLLK